MARWPDGPSCGDNSRETFPLASEEEATIRDSSAAGVSGISTEPSHPPNGECRPRFDSFLIPHFFARTKYRAYRRRPPSARRADFKRSDRTSRNVAPRRPSGSRKTLFIETPFWGRRNSLGDPIFVNIHPYREAG
ncbi:hypothetical protein ALC53_00159 [Atta colombica]|uniref:Uncharacterized protein n=1 Tax=Atta colombica TaxID=520822 RepID=A0A195BZ77_9HYME|nr:hypothetical protein ALC53_00159 [Atta colombica]